MAIFRGTGGSGSSSDSTIVDAVTAQAGIATTRRDEAEGFRDEAEGFRDEAEGFKNTATTKASEASSDAGSADLDRQACFFLRGETYDLAVDALASANAAEASATTANSSAVQTVAGSNTQVVGVYNNIANVNTVAGVNTDVTTVAGIFSDVTTVAQDASDIGIVSTNIDNVNNVGNNIANVNAVHGNASNINTVAEDGTDIGTVATNIANVNTVAGISSTVTTVAGLESKMDTVIADASDIGAVAGNIGDVTTVAGINADVDTVAGIAAKVTTVADNISDVQNADTNATNAATSASNASASATSASNSATTATTKATEASNSATAANNSATTATTKASQAAGSATTAGTSASTATTKASEASASATTATTKAGEAASSASAASGDATTATTKAAEADASATSAATSATNSSNAASTWNNFYNSYLGAADAQPTADVQGNAIVAGALYYDTGAGSNTVGLYVYNGSTWVYSTNYNNVTAPYSLAQDLATNGNDISFGDNDKAKFGASDDLQIYHDGVSRIKEVGAGGLYVDVTNDMYIRRGDTSAVMAEFNAGVAKLMFDGSQKLATTNTGIDVTGKATMDGLVVTSGSSSDNIMQVFGGGTIYAGLGVDGTGAVLTAGSSGSADSDLIIKTSSSGTEKQRARFQDNGDISFYEDTGTTPKFFWDASAERLGIGTTSPASEVDISKASGGDSALSLTSTGIQRHQIIQKGTGDGGLVFYNQTASSERMRIDSSGRVGIGTASPAQELHVVSSGESDIRLQGSGGANHVDFFHNASDFGLWGTGTQQLKLATNNTERLRIDSSGRVGIGTNSPKTHLDVASSSGAEITLTNTTGSLGANVKLGAINFYNSDASSDGANNAAIIEAQSATGTGASANLLFKTKVQGVDGADATEAMRIDSSGKVGIGTTSPEKDLHISSASGSAKLTSTVGGANIYMQSADNNTTRIRWNSNSNFAIRNDATSSDVFNINSSGNVGIGTTSPATKLAVHAGTSGTDVDVASFNSASGALNIQCSDLAATNPTWTLRSFYGEPIAFAQATSERMRIDASGNVFVGQTSTGDYTTTAGSSFRASGFSTHTRDGGDVLLLNRLTSDGSILQFRKDNATVGSINSDSGYLTIGKGDTGLLFQDGGDAIQPRSISGLANRDAAIDLGVSGGRFKDLYLSGGVHLGGTGSANKLDDYEEGTWTPLLTAVSGTKTWTYSAQRGTYTKVGNLVTVFFNIQLSSNGSGTDGVARITGLPFVSATDTALVAYYAFFWKQLIETGDVSLMGQLPAGGDHITFLDGSSSYPDISYINTSAFLNDRRVRGTMQYRV